MLTTDAYAGYAGRFSRSHVFPDNVIRLRLGSVSPRASPRRDIPNHGPTQSMCREEADLRREIFGVRHRVLSPPSNVRFGSPRHVSATTEGLRWQYDDFGRLDLFCSPKRLRGGNFTHSAQLRGAVTLATRSGLMDGGEDIRRTEIFGTARRIRSASPEAMNVQRSRSAGPRLVNLETDLGTTIEVDSASKSTINYRNPESHENHSAKFAQNTERCDSSLSEASGMPRGCKDGETTPSDVGSPRTLRKLVPEYHDRYEVNLIGSTLATPACEAWRVGGALGGPGDISGKWCSRASQPAHRKEETWRMLLASLYRQELTPEEINLLHGFDRYAKDSEKSVAEKLGNDRLRHEEIWQRRKYALQLKPSARLLKLRAIEKKLAKAQEYSEAARVKREADDLEKLEMRHTEQEFASKLDKMNANLREKDLLAKAKLQHELYGQLWQHILNGDIPAPLIV